MRDCPDRKAGRPKTPGVQSMELEDDYSESIADEPCGGLDNTIATCERCAEGDGGDGG